MVTLIRLCRSVALALTGFVSLGLSTVSAQQTQSSYAAMSPEFLLWPVPLTLTSAMLPSTIDRMLDESESTYRSGNLRQATDSFRGLLEIAPDTAQAWLRLGNIWQSHGALELAIRAYERSSTLSDDAVSRKALVNVAMIRLLALELLLDRIEQIDLRGEIAAPLARSVSAIQKKEQAEQISSEILARSLPIREILTRRKTTPALAARSPSVSSAAVSEPIKVELIRGQTR
jgi:tetratricopeptide (TPR) repeat protein